MRTVFMLLFAWIPIVSSKPFDLIFEPKVSSAEIQDPSSILKVLKSKYPSSTIKLLFADGDVVFCLYSIRIKSMTTYLVLVSPQYEKGRMLKIDDVNRTEDLGVFSFRVYGQNITKDGPVDDKTIVSESTVGYVFSLFDRQSVHFEMSINTNSGDKSLVVQRDEKSSWAIRIR